MDQPAAVDVILMTWDVDAWHDTRGRAAEPLSPLRLAGYAQAETFVDGAAFQASLDKIWYGSLAPTDAVKRRRVPAGGKESIQLPFKIDSAGELLFLFLSTGGLACLVFAVTAFTNDLVTSPAALTNFASCAIAIGASYVSFPVAMVYLSHFWQGPAGRGAVSPARRLARTCVLFYTAPIIKFFTRRLHAVLFVLLFSYVGVRWDRDRYLLQEGLMHAWMVSLLLSMARKVGGERARGAPYSSFCPCFRRVTWLAHEEG